jgi:hypothetical protein
MKYDYVICLTLLYITGQLIGNGHDKGYQSILITHKGPTEIKFINGTFINRNHFM